MLTPPKGAIPPHISLRTIVFSDLFFGLRVHHPAQACEDRYREHSHSRRNEERPECTRDRTSVILCSQIEACVVYQVRKRVPLKSPGYLLTTSLIVRR